MTVRRPMPPRLSDPKLYDGGYTQKHAIFDYSPSGARYSDIDILRYTEQGFAFMVWPPADIQQPVFVRDVRVRGVKADPPRSSDGRAEAGIWLGQRCDARRLSVEDAAWCGYWLGGTLLNGVIRNITCDVSMNSYPKGVGSQYDSGQAVGIYVEHIVHDTEIGYVKVKSPGTGINVEWWYRDDARGGIQGSYGLHIHDFVIETTQPGAWAIYLDAGTYGCLIEDGIIRGYNGIAHPSKLVVPSRPNVIDWPSIEFRGSGQRELIHDNAIGT